ncbi:hypothetical protein, variant 1 [Aphanomyces invadans]|nr:hypothetical protein, variant 1 [Aphanomyces invadans]ETW02707.1 hypothetical protein, variant 1 [Aphanomyces invadans]|eukprot:XP_008869312.1 hypothetical protein, variant 1 [Aphanomyces invadans]
MPRKGDAKYGIQPREPVQVNGYDCLPARGGKAGGDDYTCASRTSQGTVASSSEDESEFVPSSTFLESGVLHIRGNGVVRNGDVPNNPITPQKLKNNTKKMQKRKIGTTECTPDTKRNKGTPTPAWTSRGDGYAKQDSDDASSCDDSDEHSTSGKDAAVEEDWVWKELDQRHFRFPSRKQLAFLETLDRDAMHTVASNQAFLSLASAIPSMLPMNGMSPLHVIDRPRRGRYYLDTWGELDFLDTLKSFGKDVQFDTSEFQVYTTNHDLVHQYDDDAFEDYVSRLENAISPNAHLDERIHEYPASFGGCDGGGEMDAWTSQPELWVQRTSREPSEVDEVSDVMDMCIKALVNQSASNCHALRQVFDRVAQETELEPIFQQEKLLITEIETYYQRWRQTKAAFRSASVVSAWRTALKSQNFNAAQISAVEFATRFAS